MSKDSVFLVLVLILSGYVLADLVTREVVRFYGF